MIEPDLGGKLPKFCEPGAADDLTYPGSSDEVPKFDHELIAEDPNAPSRGIVDRYREIARLKAYGKTNTEICELLGYTASRISVILKDPFIQSEIARHRDALFNSDAIQIIKDAAPDAARRMAAIIRDPNAPNKDVIAASTFVIEKQHGKAKQEVTHDHGGIAVYFGVLKDMQKRGEVLDVTPQQIPASAGPEQSAETPQAPALEENRWDSWLDRNL